MRLLLSIVLALGAAPAPSAPPSTAPRAFPAAASTGPLSPDALFSRRALRRARLLVQMRLMQLRDERLECIRAALERRLPGALWEEVPGPERGAADVREAAEKCEEMLKF
ncbi:MAG TPA: hypothetical protein VGX91_11365 [Candidatus Cybelea sp.]|nr:hypothetical protein [Candidatus Cybelea sp.]